MTSNYGKDWEQFEDLVLRHIEEYTVPQYGDKGDDLASDYTPEECMRQVMKYAKRYGRNSRPQEQGRDFLKIAHYAQMAWTKWGETNG